MKGATKELKIKLACPPVGAEEQRVIKASWVRIVGIEAANGRFGSILGAVVGVFTPPVPPEKNKQKYPL